MSTITREPRVSPLAPAETTRVRGEERVVALGVPWVIYDRLTDAMGEGSHIRIAYDGKDMEIMVVGPIHERRKELLSSFIEEVSVGLRINFQAFGQATWKRSELERGLESDLCYYFDSAKLQAANDAAERVNGVRNPRGLTAPDPPFPHAGFAVARRAARGSCAGG
jgi:hypothetical protein